VHSQPPVSYCLSDALYCPAIYSCYKQTCTANHQSVTASVLPSIAPLFTVATTQRAQPTTSQLLSQCCPLLPRYLQLLQPNVHSQPPVSYCLSAALYCPAIYSRYNPTCTANHQSVTVSVLPSIAPLFTVATAHRSQPTTSQLLSQCCPLLSRYLQSLQHTVHSQPPVSYCLRAALYCPAIYIRYNPPCTANNQSLYASVLPTIALLVTVATTQRAQPTTGQLPSQCYPLSPRYSLTVHVPQLLWFVSICMIETGTVVDWLL